MKQPAATISETLRAAAALLEPVSDTSRLDAEILMAHALGTTRNEMLMRQNDLAVPVGFHALLGRRAASEPVAYIRGTQAFWDLDLVVTPDVLIPRGDSETLIEMAIDAFADRAGPDRLLDLGTGSGALLLAALSVFGNASGIGIDASGAALAVAERNARSLGFANRAAFREVSWLESGWQADLGQFDLILCNPPYVETGAALHPTVSEHEPHSALFAGLDGLDDYRAIVPQIPRLLARGGIAIFEIGHQQTAAVSDLARVEGLSTEMRRDLAGNARALRFSLGIGRTHR